MYYDSTGLVGQYCFGFHLVNILTTGASTTGEVPGDLGGIDLDLNAVINEWIHINTRKTCMPFRIAVKRRNTNQTMDAIFTLQPTKSEFSFYFEGDCFYPCYISVLEIEFFYFIAVFLSPHQIHAHKHLRPVTAFGASCSGSDLEYSA